MGFFKSSFIIIFFCEKFPPRSLSSIHYSYIVLDYQDVNSFVNFGELSIPNPYLDHCYSISNSCTFIGNLKSLELKLEGWRTPAHHPHPLTWRLCKVNLYCFIWIAGILLAPLIIKLLQMMQNCYLTFFMLMILCFSITLPYSKYINHWLVKTWCVFC